MFRRFSINFALFSMGLDLVLVALSLLVASTMRPQLSALPFAATIPDPVHPPWLLYISFPVIWVAVLLLFSVYDGRRNMRVVDELTALILGSALASVAMAGTLYLSFRDISRLLFVVFVLIAFLTMMLWRVIARVIMGLENNDLTSLRQVLIVGAGPVGRQLQEQIEKNPQLGLRLVGFLDDNTTKRNQYKEILGCVQEAPKIVTNLKIDDVVIALPPRAHRSINRLAVELHTLPVKVWVIPDYFNLALHKAVV